MSSWKRCGPFPWVSWSGMRSARRLYGSWRAVCYMTAIAVVSATVRSCSRWSMPVGTWMWSDASSEVGPAGRGNGAAGASRSRERFRYWRDQAVPAGLGCRAGREPQGCERAYGRAVQARRCRALLRRWRGPSGALSSVFLSEDCDSLEGRCAGSCARVCPCFEVRCVGAAI